MILYSFPLSLASTIISQFSESVNSQIRSSYSLSTFVQCPRGYCLRMRGFGFSPFGLLTLSVHSTHHAPVFVSRAPMRVGLAAIGRLLWLMLLEAFKG